MITTEIGVCDYIKAKVRSPRTIMISFDEYACNFDHPGKTAPGRTGYIPPENYGEFTDGEQVISDMIDKNGMYAHPRIIMSE